MLVCTCAFSNYQSDSQPTTWGATWGAIKLSWCFESELNLGDMWPLTSFYKSVCSPSLMSHIMYFTKKCKIEPCEWMSRPSRACVCEGKCTPHMSHRQCLLSFQRRYSHLITPHYLASHHPYFSSPVSLSPRSLSLGVER